MDNEELKTYGVFELGACPRFYKRLTCPKQGDCDVTDMEACWLNWLNAPADCVKQNGNHDTQADLCKADNTESEGKDE
jgi:hypothetical protein